jgi:hypothetical protein
MIFLLLYWKLFIYNLVKTYHLLSSTLLSHAKSKSNGSYESDDSLTKLDQKTHVNISIKPKNR